MGVMAETTALQNVRLMRMHFYESILLMAVETTR